MKCPQEETLESNVPLQIRRLVAESVQNLGAITIFKCEVLFCVATSCT